MTGPVAGRPIAHGTVFHSVPYAAPPVGAHRFTAPRPHEPWTAVRDATQPGPTAPQPLRDSFGTLDLSPYFGPGWRRGADYLTADIWAPAHGPAPVLVFVHGGGFLAGSSGAPLYDGTAFVRDGILLVAVNYRLGIPGFLRLPDAPDNRGLLDVIAALEWVREHIADFGGDPGNVTLAGQSAGAIIVGGVLASPSARGLFRRAIMQSGSGTAALHPAQAEVVTAALGGGTARSLAGVPDEQLVEMLPALSAVDVPGHPLPGVTPFSLVLDSQPADAIAVDADLLIGSNLDEGNLYLRRPSTEADIWSTAARFHPRPDDLVRAYAGRATLAETHAAILGDGLFGAGTRRMAAAHGSAFVYEFTWRSDTLGASHVMELPFVFDNTELPALRGLLGSTAPPADLAARTHEIWVRFAATGDPGWPRSAPGRRRVQELGVTWGLAENPRPQEAAAWP
ncbi:MAG: carboxylesterase family protein [Actinoplanes sp.]